MKIGLFIPCYVDVVYPHVGVATYKLLKHLGIDVDYPLDQTCCGQPMANAGFEKQAVPLAEKFERQVQGFRLCRSTFCQLHRLYQTQLSTPAERQARLYDFKQNHGCS